MKDGTVVAHTYAHSAYLAPRVILNLLHFTDFAMRQAFLWKILEPSVGGFLTNILFKLAFMDPEHRQMFFDEPVDFCNLAEVGMHVLFLLFVPLANLEAGREVGLFS